MRALLLGCIIGTAALQEVSGQVRERIDPKIDSAVNAAAPVARVAIDTLKRVVKPGNYRAMGFDSLSQVATAILGPPLAIFRIVPKELDAFRPPATGLELFHGPDRVFYPVLVGSEWRTSFILVRQGVQWRSASYGGAGPARLASAAIHTADSLLPRGPRRYFWVEILGPSVGFIGTQLRTTLVLIPLADDRQRRWQAFVPITADSVFPLLAAQARGHNQLPR
jgi:hypothetical protein